MYLCVFGRPLRYAPIPVSDRILQNTAKYYKILLGEYRPHIWGKSDPSPYTLTISRDLKISKIRTRLRERIVETSHSPVFQTMCSSQIESIKVSLDCVSARLAPHPCNLQLFTGGGGGLNPPLVSFPRRHGPGARTSIKVISTIKSRSRLYTTPPLGGRGDRAAKVASAHAALCHVQLWCT